MMKRHLAKKEAQKASKNQIANPQMVGVAQSGFVYDISSQHAELAQQAFMQSMMLQQHMMHSANLAMQTAAAQQGHPIMYETITRETSGNKTTVRHSRQMVFSAAEQNPEKSKKSNKSMTCPLTEEESYRSQEDAHAIRKLMKQTHMGGVAPTIEEID